MSHSIFSSALGRAIHRRPPSATLLLRLNCPFIHRTKEQQQSRCALYNATTPGTGRHSKSVSRAASTAAPVRHRWIERRRKRDKNMGKGGPEACYRRPKTLLALLHLLDRALDVRGRFHPEKADLTFSDPLVRGKRREKVKKQKVIWRLRKGPTWTREWMGSVSLKSITYDYMYHFLLELEGDLEDLDAVDKVFGQNAVEYLAERGYGPEDVVVWVWILMAKDEYEAAMRIDVWARLGASMAIDSHGEANIPNESLKDSIREIFQGDSFNPLDSDDLPDAQPITRSYQIPPFIILHNLRRPHAHINARVIRQLLPHVEESLFSPKSLQSGDFKTPLLILIRLLRHARSSWPAAIPHVADLLTKVHSSDRPPRRTARLTNTYNRLLTLLSLAPNDRPFQSMQLLQQSQFTLLRKMASLDIPITREGYRALITVQLAHPKTHTEALHVKSLSTNWPPWPIPKDGHHLSPGHSPSPHLSRAAQVLQQMTAAGYHHLGWEKEALVLSGTDTDSSPTIQTRTFYRPGRSSPSKVPQNIWAVRIRATRTLDEAWNIFLECTSTMPVPAPLVWEEMFYKVVSARKVHRLLDSHHQRLEAIKATHDPSLPPTPETLQAVEKWDIINREMAQRKGRVLPGDAKEVSIPPASPSDRVYVPVKPPTVDELLSMMRRVCGKNVRISPYLLAQLVREADNLEQGERLITLWSQEQFRRLLKSAQHDAPRTFARYEAYADWHLLTSYFSLLLRTPTPPRIDLALRLLRGQSPRYPPAWNVVLTALANINLHMPQGVKIARLELVWRLYSSMVQLRAQPDSETLRVLCVTAERATGIDVLWDGEGPVDVMIRVVQSAFGIGRTGEVPLLEPDMAALHAYVRMLGFSGREDAIAALVGWMKEAGLDVATVTGRRVVVACAVFVKDEVLVRELADGWPGVEWPGEDEVERYCVRGWTGKVIEKEDSGDYLSGH